MDRKTYIPTEQIDKRNEYTKTYTVGPARYRAFSSSVPLHVRSQESWEEIDARFVPDKSYGDDSIVSRGGHLTAVCAPSGKDAFITVADHKDHSLSWSIEGAKAVVPEAVEEKADTAAKVNAEILRGMAAGAAGIAGAPRPRRRPGAVRRRIRRRTARCSTQ